MHRSFAAQAVQLCEREDLVQFQALGGEGGSKAHVR